MLVFVRSLELAPFNMKSLLRRAAAYEALERYRQAYVDYKTALQIDCTIASAHDGTNRSVRLLPWSETLGAAPLHADVLLFSPQDDEGAH